ncbi:unnamed protein product [Porites lobata]|uniref:Cysteine rich secreted protein n=1 Tax=Porites lobata TaxID=104759 RepID=A0ABN8NAG0_9CNID|nr:unnamed protein product [Porites lobata]
MSPIFALLFTVMITLAPAHIFFEDSQCEQLGFKCVPLGCNCSGLELLCPRYKPKCCDPMQKMQQIKLYRRRYRSKQGEQEKLSG